VRVRTVLGSRKAGLDWFGLDGILLLVGIASFVPVGFWSTLLGGVASSLEGNLTVEKMTPGCSAQCAIVDWKWDGCTVS